MKQFYIVTISYRLWDKESDDFDAPVAWVDSVWARGEEHARRLALSDFLADPPGLCKTTGVHVEPANITVIVQAHEHSTSTPVPALAH